MSSSQPNSLLKTKRERKQKKTESSNKKLETQSLKSGEFDGDDDNNDDIKQENSLGKLTINFLKHIKEKGRVNININSLVTDLKVKKRRIYDITNVLQGMGYIEKNGKNEIKWNQSYRNPENILNKNSLPESFLSNCNKLKLELDELKREEKKIDEELNKYNEEFNYISKKKDFPKYGYITFNDLIKLSKSENLNFMIIKATKGTVINVIDDEESKKAYLKIKKQMENGKIEQNYDLLSTLENLHHIFFTTKDDKIRIFRIEKGEVTETLKNPQNCAENNNKNLINNNNNSLISNQNNNNKYNGQNNLINIKNNIIFKEKESLGKKNILNIEENLKIANTFNFDQNNYINNYAAPPIIKEKNINNDKYNNINSGVSIFKNNNKQFFTFSKEEENSNNDYNSLINIKNKNLINNNAYNEDINEKKSAI
jgi:transcription factor E2F3